MCHVRRVPVTTASQRNICAEWKSNLGTGEASRNISILRDLIGGKEAILPQQGIGTASEWPTISESAHGGVWLLLSRYSLNTCRWPRQMIFTSCALRQLGRNHEGSGGRGAFECCPHFCQLPEYRRNHWIRQQKPTSGGTSQVAELRVGHQGSDHLFHNPEIPIAHGAEIITGRTLVNDRSICPNAAFPDTEIQEHVPASA